MSRSICHTSAHIRCYLHSSTYMCTRACTRVRTRVPIMLDWSMYVMYVLLQNTWHDMRACTKIYILYTCQSTRARTGGVLDKRSWTSFGDGPGTGSWSWGVQFNWIPVDDSEWFPVRIGSVLVYRYRYTKLLIQAGNIRTNFIWPHQDSNISSLTKVKWLSRMPAGYGGPTVRSVTQ